MSANQAIRMLIEITGIIILILISITYTRIYISTRKLDIKTSELWRILKKNLLICFLANAFLVFSEPFSECGSYKYLLLLLFGMTENIDIFIRKIPTELLILEFILTVIQITRHGNLLDIAASLLFSSVWFLLKRKIRIGTNDILLILILTVFLSDFSGTILFNSVIMIIWGAVGLIIQKAFNKEPQTKIPLAPVIITAFTLVKLLT